MAATKRTLSVTFEGQTFTRVFNNRSITHAVCCDSPKLGAFTVSWHTSKDAADKACRMRTTDKFDRSGGGVYSVVAVD